MQDHPEYHASRRTSLRKLLALCAAPLAPAAFSALSAFSTRSAFAQTAAPAVFRIGFQKGGPVTVAAKARHSFESRLSKLGVSKVSWLEFPFGPPMLEAITARAVDLGTVGDTPPIFAQAGGGGINYVLATPGSVHGIVVPKDSPIRTLADLKGKRVAFGKGSSAHNVIFKALQLAGLGYQDIQPIYLGPADASAAFTSRKVDAWVIWDPYYALAEERLGARVIADTKKFPQLDSHAFFIAGQHFVQDYPRVMHAALDTIIETSQWAGAHHAETAALLAQSTGLDLAIWKRAIDRESFSCSPITDSIVAAQQKTADAFFAQKLIPKKIEVRDIVWRG